MAGAAGGPGGNVPQYEEASERNSQVFHVGSFGALWREALRPQDLSLQQAATEDEDAAAAEELGCPLDIVPELREVCSIGALKSPSKEDTEEIPEDTNLITLLKRSSMRNVPSEELDWRLPFCCVVLWWFLVISHFGAGKRSRTLNPVALSSDFQSLHQKKGI